MAVKLIQLASQADETARARFTREAQAAAGLVHPNIVTVHDFGVDDGIAYMVMEYLPGPDLATLVRAGGALPVDRALDYLEQAAAGLAAAHLRGILHRDVKPANLMLSEIGTVKVLDFGIAALADRSEQLTATSQLIGTLSYLAPERSMGSPATVQSDLYALGCVAVTLLTGRPPFEGTTGQIIFKHLNESVPQLGSRRPDLPASLDGLIGSLLAKDPSRRPSSAEDVVNQLRAASRELVPGDPAAAKASLPVPSVVSAEEVHDEEQVRDTVRRAAGVPGGAPPSLGDTARRPSHGVENSTVIRPAGPLLASTARPRPGAWRLRPVLAVLLPLVAMGGGFVAWYLYTQQQYYIGPNDAYVAIFQGIHEPGLGLPLSRAVQTDTTRVDDLPPYYKEQVLATMKVESLDKGQATLLELRQKAEECIALRAARARATATPSPSATPTKASWSGSVKPARTHAATPATSPTSEAMPTPTPTSAEIPAAMTEC